MRELPIFFVECNILIVSSAFKFCSSGYMSPEYAMYGQFSMKSDVYSFGVYYQRQEEQQPLSNGWQCWQFDYICEYRAFKLPLFSAFFDDDQRFNYSYVQQTWRLWHNGSTLELMDPLFQDNYETNEITRCIHIALLCVQEEAEDRPTLSEMSRCSLRV